MTHYFNQTITNKSVREQLAKMIVGAKTLNANNSIQMNRGRIQTANKNSSLTHKGKKKKK